MTEEQKGPSFAKGLGFLAIDAPGDDVRRNNIVVRCNNIPGDILGSLRGPKRDELRVWIEDEARNASPWQYKSIPTLSILECPDLLDRLWGWDRLLAYDLECEFEDPSDMPMYESYLDKFYASNHQNIAADAILQCLEKEKALSSKWKAKMGRVFPFNTELSKDIQECMSSVMNDAGSEPRRPFITYAAACITKEAELMIEWLNQGVDVPHEEHNTNNEIRQWALDLAMLEGNWSTCAAAVLLGITKEACFLLERASRGCLDSTDISLRIRTYGLNFLFHKLDGFDSDAELTLGASDDMTSATEINPLTWGNTESFGFGKNGMQEQFVSKKIIDPENIISEGYPVILRRPNVVDGQAE